MGALPGIAPNQVILILILIGSVILLFTGWIRLDLTAILKAPVWHNLMIPQVCFDPVQAQFWYFVGSDSL